MNHQHAIQQLLTAIGSGRTSTSAYDTAWVARLQAIDAPLSANALNWLRANQLPDGSWGAVAPHYYHDRAICTLAAIIALARSGQLEDHKRIQQALPTLATALARLHTDPSGETIAFEMLVPTLLAEAKSLGIINYGAERAVGMMVSQRAAKLARLSRGLIHRQTTLAFSAEMVGAEGLHLLDLENLEQTNGSVGCSPAATAFVALQTQPGSATLRYLHKSVEQGAIAHVSPIDIFEIAWTLWNLALLPALDRQTLALCQPHLDVLERNWQPGRGVSCSTNYPVVDSDDSAMVYKVLTHYGRTVDLAALLSYEEAEHFRCFEMEVNPSISANVHVLDALGVAGLSVDHASVQKILRFLQRSRRPQGYWRDKWHISPYYTTAHAMMTGSSYATSLFQPAVDWMLATQNADGSWGHYQQATAEETAYCLQALVSWRRLGQPVAQDTLRQGAHWLAEHAAPPYPTLWIGKSLYAPERVVRAAILSALILCEEELGRCRRMHLPTVQHCALAHVGRLESQPATIVA